LTSSNPTSSSESVVVALSPQASELYRRRAVEQQWSLTASAIQAAEAIESFFANTKIHLLELGGGAGVFSAAIAHRFPEVQVASVDVKEMLTQTRTTFESIEIEDRLTAIESDYRSYDVPLAEADAVLLPMVVRLHADPSAVVLLGRACDALKEEGIVIIIEPLDEPEFPDNHHALESLDMKREGCEGTIRSSRQLQLLLTGAGFGEAQWGILERSIPPLGLVIARKPTNPNT